jgi:hypothetical protein
MSRDGRGGESTGCIPGEGKGGIMSATVIHVEWTEEELF